MERLEGMHVVAIRAMRRGFVTVAEPAGFVVNPVAPLCMLKRSPATFARIYCCMLANQFSFSENSRLVVDGQRCRP
jgi:hypothetical protein